MGSVPLNARNPLRLRTHTGIAAIVTAVIGSCTLVSSVSAQADSLSHRSALNLILAPGVTGFGAFVGGGLEVHPVPQSIGARLGVDLFFTDPAASKPIMLDAGITHRLPLRSMTSVFGLALGTAIHRDWQFFALARAGVELSNIPLGIELRGYFRLHSGLQQAAGAAITYRISQRSQSR